MKGKHVFLTLGLSLMMGLGVAAGFALNKEVKQAKAASAGDELTFFCNVSNASWWSNDGAELRLQTWNGSADVQYEGTWVTPTLFRVKDADTTNWVGFKFVRRLSAETSYDFSSWCTDFDTRYFTHAGSDQNGTWSDTVPTFHDVEVHVDENQYDEVVGDGQLPATPALTYGQSFSGWFSDSNCTPGNEVTSITSDMTVYSKIIQHVLVSYQLDLSAVSAVFGADGEEDKVFLHAWDQGGVNHAWPGIELAGTTFEVYDDAEIIIANVHAGEVNAQTVDIPQSGIADDTLRVLATQTAGKYKYEWASEALVSNEYYVQVGDGEFQQMTYVKDFTYDETKTGKEYELEISAISGAILHFRRGASETIYPGASDGDLTNNLAWLSGEPSRIQVLTTTTDETLTLKVYESGYDTFLTGYHANNKTVYFTNNKGWEGIPYYFAYNVNGNPFTAAWPGDEMTYVDIDKNGQPRYSLTLDVQKYNNFIINDGNGEQTVDLRVTDFLVKDGCYLTDKNGEGKYEVEKYSYSAVTRTINIGGIDYSLTPSAVQPGGNCLLQLETEQFDLESGDQIIYKADGEAATFSLESYYTNNAYIDGNDSDKPKVLVAATDEQVFVKLMKDCSVVVYVGGVSGFAQGYHVLLNKNVQNSDLIEMVHTDDFDGFTQYSSQAINFVEDDTVSFVDMHDEHALPVVFDITNISEYGLGSKFAVQGGTIVCLEDVTTSVYLKLKMGEDEIYFGEVKEYMAAAKAFASAFNSAIEAVCDYNGVDTVKATLEEAWAAQATAFAALTEESQNVLKNAAESGDATIVAFGAKYESVYRLRAMGSGWTLADFMAKNFASNSMHQVSIANNTTLVVILVSMITVISAAGLFLVIRRRKHQ